MPVPVVSQSFSPVPAAQASALCRFAVCAVASAFRLPGEEVVLRLRPEAAALRARRCAMYLAHVAFRLPQKRVARVFGRDPAIVRQGCAYIEDARDCRTFDRALTHLEAAGGAWARAFLGLNVGGAR